MIDSDVLDRHLGTSQSSNHLGSRRHILAKCLLKIASNSSALIVYR